MKKKNKHIDNQLIKWEILEHFLQFTFYIRARSRAGYNMCAMCAVCVPRKRTLNLNKHAHFTVFNAFFIIYILNNIKFVFALFCQ